MSAVDGTALAAKVVAIIADVGETATFTVATVAPTYNPATGGITGGTSSTIAVKVSPLIPNRSTMRTGDTARQGDGVIYVPAASLSWTPTPGQKLTMAGTGWTVQTVELYSVVGVPIVYTLILAKGSG
jgi:hypothetical protein